MTLDRGDFFPFASSAVKGHFIEFLVSNIVVTSLSSYFGALPRQRDHFLQHTACNRFNDTPECGINKVAVVLLCILGLQCTPHV